MLNNPFHKEERREKKEKEKVDEIEMGTNLNGDDEVASVFQEVVGVQGNNTGLVGLRNIGEDDINLRRKNRKRKAGLIRFFVLFS